MAFAQSAVAERLRREVRGEVAFDELTRGIYATDASIYQIQPLGVVVPKSIDDVVAVRSICADAGVPILPRGAGTSQCGQTVNAAIVVDCSKHLCEIEELDVAAKRVRVQPGLVLDHLNARLRGSGLFFPVDPSTASRATIGGMTANNSSGARSLRYGMMIHNVLGIDAILADGTRARFDESSGSAGAPLPPRQAELLARVREIAAREADEIARRYPKVMRRVGGYNLDVVRPGGFNFAELLVGSEGTLGFFTSIDLKLQPLPREKVLGIAHFPRFYDAMAATKELVKSGPVAIELVDRTMLELSRKNPTFGPTIERYVEGDPDAILLVEFTGDDPSALREKLVELDERMSEIGFPRSVVNVTDAKGQAEIWTVRSAGLNIMTSMKGDAKPVSIIEDCAVGLDDLAEYTERLTRLFEKHGTWGTWYAHASVGCLHVRPVLNMKSGEDVGKLRAIAEEAFAIVREYGGSHSGEHGDGIVRSEFHKEMFGERLVRAFEEVKDAFDPAAILNPGKIVRAPRMDDRSLFRYAENYAPIVLDEALDWSEWGGFSGAVEMCNNNGACRKSDPGVMCPSYMVTQDEEHVTRGRANALRLALSGQLGPDALTSEKMYEAMDLCVGCKGCRRECPTGVDMARMKVEFLHRYRKQHGWRMKDRIVAHFPRAGSLMRFGRFAIAMRNRFGVLAKMTESLTGMSAKRKLPVPSARPFRDDALRRKNGNQAREVVLFVDTFDRYFEPENVRAAMRVLEAGGYDAIFPQVRGRPLCCGRTYLAAGMVDQARAEAARTIEALEGYARSGFPIVGLEPSCLLTLRDEFLALCPGDAAQAVASQAMMFEDFIVREKAAGRLQLPLREPARKNVLVHGHCHQKAFGQMPAVLETLGMIPGLEVSSIESSCCGMAGSFGYETEHYDISQAMAELSLLPAVRAAASGATIVADGTSCRHQITEGTGREARHLARVLDDALA